MRLARGANSLRQFSEEGGEGVGGELRGVECGLLEAAESIGDLRRGDAAGVGKGFPGHKFGEYGGAGERGDAALCFEAHGGDLAVIDAGSETKNVAANGIGDVDNGGGAGKLAGVTGIFEVVEDSGRMHGKKVYS